MNTAMRTPLLFVVTIYYFADKESIGCRSVDAEIQFSGLYK
jgi:hypothetical protein